MSKPLAIQSAAAFIVGVFITFSQIHNALIGNLSLAVLSLAFAASFAVEIAAGKKLKRAKVAVFFGIAVIAILVLADPNVLWFLSLVILFALTAALLEIKKASRDSRLTALINFGFIAALAISTALTGLDPVAYVGFFGAYAIILSVHLGISAASPKA